MMRAFTTILFVISFFMPVALWSAGFTLTASKNLSDRVSIKITPAYPYEGTIVETLDPKACFDVHTPTPLPADPSKYQAVTSSNTFFYSTADIDDYNAPKGINICYMLLGRGQVEAKVTGFRAVNWPLVKPTNNGFNATRDRNDGIALMMTPAITDFSTLYVAPVEDNNCPDIGKPFSGQGRFQTVMAESFNGQYYFHSEAPMAIELCYFLLSQKDQTCIAKAIGFRQP